MLQMHSMGLQKKYFDFFLHGSKRIELRLNDEKRRNIKVGDILVFSCGKESFKCEVVERLEYPTFADMFRNFDDASLFADKSVSKDEMLGVMEEFYPISKQKALGVVGLRVDKIQSL